MATALDIIKSAMEKLGLIGPGDSVSAEDAATCLDLLNDLVGGSKHDDGS